MGSRQAAGSELTHREAYREAYRGAYREAYRETYREAYRETYNSDGHDSSRSKRLARRRYGRKRPFELDSLSEEAYGVRFGFAAWNAGSTIDRRAIDRREMMPPNAHATKAQLARCRPRQRADRSDWGVAPEGEGR